MESEKTYRSYAKNGKTFRDASALHGLNTEMLAHLKKHKGHYKDMGISAAAMDSMTDHLVGWNTAFERHKDNLQKSIGKVIPDSIRFAVEAGSNKGAFPKKAAHRLITKCLCGDPARLEHNGHTYALVGIGDQCWFAENLTTALYANGDSIPHVSDNTAWKTLATGAWAHYGNDGAKGVTYGKLYNWYAVGAARGLCPKGWHVPKQQEWFALLNSIDATVDNPTAFSFIGWNAGSKMKTQGTRHWESPNLGATNESGFSALPGGQVGHKGTFEDIAVKGLWWSSSERDKKEAWYYGTISYSTYPMKESAAKFRGFSVRCIKD
ncbi:MAG: fibrobacter succinogenes major paralogous domain-containing protein [Flavobacteriales bacterium]|nr:fibrobacter succinogenes major paralogous domain-containing protein [Flavobacteriales bacterium]